jgi:hypothetical protein
VNARGVFFGVVSALLSSTESGNGTVYRPQSLSRGQVLAWTPELTQMYGAPYVALLQATARK